MDWEIEVTRLSELLHELPLDADERKMVLYQVGEVCKAVVRQAGADALDAFKSSLMERP